jgi:hypothetical protein
MRCFDERLVTVLKPSIQRLAAGLIAARCIADLRDANSVVRGTWRTLDRDSLVHDMRGGVSARNTPWSTVMWESTVPGWNGMYRGAKKKACTVQSIYERSPLRVHVLL